MKSVLFCLVALCFFVLNCHARCDCEAVDSACISKCVVEANSCVTSCKGNIDCYNGCINDKWPSAGITDIPSFKQVLASSTGASASPTASVSGSATSATASATGSLSGSASPVRSSASASASQTGTSMGSTLKSDIVIPFLLVSLSIFYFMV